MTENNNLNKDDLFKKWSEKMAIPVETIQQDFNKAFMDLKQNHKLEDDKAQTMALKQIASAYKKQLRSPAEGFEGVVLGAEEPRDLVAKKRRDALELYRANPQEAVAQGVTDDDGTPLDIIQFFSTGRENPNYGKPLPEKSLIRRVFGVAMKPTDQHPKMFEMVLNGDACEKEIPIMKPVKFMAIEKSKKEDEAFKLNASTFTEFSEVAEITGNPKIEDLIKNFIPPIKVSELEEYHEKNADDFNRIVCVEGNVNFISLEPTMTGSRILQIEDDENTLDLDTKPTTCWVPQHINMDFGEGSKVYVIGRTSQGFLKDESGNMTSEKGDVTINTFGIYPVDEISVPQTEDISIL